jgi:hypothetical protein
MTLDEVTRKYSERFWRTFYELGEAASLKSFMACAGIEEFYRNKMTRLLDDIANDGFYVELFRSCLPRSEWGMFFVPIPDWELKAIRRKYAERYKEEPWNGDESCTTLKG